MKEITNSLCKQLLQNQNSIEMSIRTQQGYLFIESKLKTKRQRKLYC